MRSPRSTPTRSWSPARARCRRRSRATWAGSGPSGCGTRRPPGRGTGSARAARPVQRPARTRGGAGVAGTAVRGVTARLKPLAGAAAAVHPLSPANSRLLFEPSPAGAAAGWTAADVQERGLCSALAQRGLVRAIRGEDPALPLTEEWLAGDEETAFALGSLRHIGHTARVYALPGAAPAFAVLAVVEGADGGAVDWATGSALSVRAAVREAVRDAVGLAVGRHYEGAPMDPGDPLVADFDPRTLTEGDAKAEWSFDQPGVPMSEALGRLDADGTRALFVDTTPIDLSAIRAMVTGTILLAVK